LTLATFSAKKEGSSCGEEGYWLIGKFIKKSEITEKKILAKEMFLLPFKCSRKSWMKKFKQSV